MIEPEHIADITEKKKSISDPRCPPGYVYIKSFWRNGMNNAYIRGHCRRVRK